MFPVDIWGNVGDWLTVIFSGASALTAFSILKRDRERGQWMEARNIKLNVSPVIKATPPSLPGEPPDHYWLVSVECTNASSYPIYEISIEVRPKHKRAVVANLKPFDGNDPLPLSPQSTKFFTAQTPIIDDSATPEQFSSAVDIYLHFQTYDGGRFVYDAKTWALSREHGWISSPLARLRQERIGRRARRAQ